MITILAKCTVKEDKVEEFKQLAAQLVVASNKEDGCMYYELLQDLNEPIKFVFVEKWENQEAINFHNNSDHFTTIVPKLKELQTKSDVALYKLA